jgi:hypothetical protein
MARRDDRPQTQSPGQWTHYRGRWWRFTGTSWVESDEPVEKGDGEETPQTLLRYHRDGAGVYWLQHPRTGAWHRHVDGAWVPSDVPPPDLDPEPLAPAETAERAKSASTKRPPPRSARLIIIISVAALLVAAVVLLLAHGGTGHGASPHAATSTTNAGHAPTTQPSVATTAPTTTIAPQGPTTTTAPPGPGTVRLRASGLGNDQTRQFTVGGPWDLNYSFNCGNEGIGASDNFIVNVNGYGPAARTTDRGVNTVGSGQSGHQHYTDAGTFSLTVQTNCRWNVRVVEP